MDREITGEVVGILRRDGEISYLKWLGFVERTDAANWLSAVSVKIDVVAYSIKDCMPAYWIDLDRGTGEMIQGCYVGTGVYAVTEQGVPRVVKRTGRNRN